MAEIPVETSMYRELPMKPTFLIALSLAAVSLAAAHPLHASPRLWAAASSSAQADAGKKIQMTLRNDSAEPVEFKVGEDVVPLDAGKSAALKVPAGTRIVANKAYGAHQAGDLILQVSKEFNGATLHVK
jgi:ABC-type amino acid transport substrate-binding protein